MLQHGSIVTETCWYALAGSFWVSRVTDVSRYDWLAGHAAGASKTGRVLAQLRADHSP